LLAFGTNKLNKLLGRVTPAKDTMSQKIKLADLSKKTEWESYLKYADPPGYTFQWTEGKENIWVPHEGTFAHAIVKKKDTGKHGYWVCELQATKQEKTFSLLEFADLPESHMNPRAFDGRNDCSDLPNLSVGSVMHNLRIRYKSKVIYTYSGLFTVAINPYALFPIYLDPVCSFYQGKKRDQCPPHVFATAEFAYQCLCLDKDDQAILITGESGAGKTENTKRVIQYLAYTAGESKSASAGSDRSLDDRLLMANPLLESVGNACTRKNDNSSRFGKFIKITFSQKGKISGASIVHYLLEKSRVVSRGSGERNFHIFYQILTGMDISKKNALGLTRPEDYGYLTQTDPDKEQKYACSQDDAKEFELANQAMDTLGFTSQEKDTVFAVVAAILHLGNVRFTGEVANLVNPEVIVDQVAPLIHIDGRQLCLALTHPHIYVKGEKIKRDISSTKAQANLDAFAKALYSRMFDWIVDKINASLTEKKNHHFIGILDIAGFEIFKFNSFEQLCINFTNERLQQFFNHFMFESEQEEYRVEGLSWTIQNFGIEGKSTIDLISARPKGILIILDDENSRGVENTTDKEFAAKLKDAHKHMPRFEGTPKLAAGIEKTAVDVMFAIKHYAGEVSYNVTNWLEKNKDPLETDIADVVKGSRNKSLATFFEKFQLGGPGAQNVKAAAFITIANQYRGQLDDLMNTLKKTHPHFIRCIIPNHDKTGEYLNDPIVIEQLRCNGVLEGIKISRKGYPNRMKFADFLKMYYLLADGVLKKSAEPKQSCQRIIDQLLKENVFVLKEPKETYNNVQLGLSKIFFRVGILGKIENAREQKMAKLIPTCQAAIRGLIARRVFNASKERENSVRVIQRAVRQFVELNKWPWFLLYQKIKPEITHVDYDELARQQEAEKAALARELAKSQAEKERANLRIKELEQDISRAQNDVTNTQNKLDSLEGNHFTLEEQVKKLRMDMAEQEVDLDDVVNKVSAGDGKIKDLKREADDLVNELSQLESDASKKKSEKAVQESQLNALQNNLQSEKDQANKYKNSLLSILREIDQNTEDIKRVEEEIANLQRLKESAATELDDLFDELDEHTKTKAGLEKQSQTLNDLLKDTNRDMTSESTARGLVEGNNKKLSDKNNGLKNDITREQQANQALEKNNQQLEVQISELNEAVEDENNKKKTIGTNLKKVSDELADTRNSIESETQHRQKLSGEKSRLEAQLEDLKRQLDEAKAKIGRLEKEVKALQTQLLELTSQNEEAESKHGNLANNNKRLKSELEDLREKTDGLEGNVGKLKKVVAGLESNKKTKERELADEKEGKNRKELEKKNLQAELEALRVRLDEMSKNRAKEEKSRKDLEGKCRELEDALEAKKSDTSSAQKKVDAAEDELDDTQGQVDELNEEVNALTHARAKLESDLDALKKSLDTEAAARKSAEDKLKSLDGELIDLQNALTTAETKNQNLNRNHKKLQSEVEDLTENYDVNSKELSKNDKIVKKTDAELKDVKRQVTDAQGSLDQGDIKLRRDQDALALLTQAVQGLDQKAGDLDRKKRQLQSQVDDMEETAEEEATGRQKAERHKKDLEFQLEELSASTVGSGAIGDAEKKAKALENQLADIRRNIDHEEAAASKSEAARKAALRDFEEAQGRLDDENKALANTERLRKKLQSELEEAQGKVEKAANSQKNLDKRLHAAEKALAAAKASSGKGGGASDEELRRAQQEVAALREEADRERSQKLAAEKRAKNLTTEIEELKEMLDDDKTEKESLIRNNKSIESELDELREQLEAEEESLNFLEEIKHKKDLEINELRKQLDAESEARDKFEQLKNELERELADSRHVLETEKKARTDSERAAKNAQSQYDDLKARSESSSKGKDKVEKERKRVIKDL
jgi:myosin heavy subunit